MSTPTLRRLALIVSYDNRRLGLRDLLRLDPDIFDYVLWRGMYRGYTLPLRLYLRAATTGLKLQLLWRRYFQ